MMQEQQNSHWYHVIPETRTRGLLWAAKNELQTYSQEGYQHDPVGNPVSKLAAQIISVLAEERILFSS